MENELKIVAQNLLVEVRNLRNSVSNFSMELQAIRDDQQQLRTLIRTNANRIKEMTLANAIRPPMADDFVPSVCFDYPILNTPDKKKLYRHPQNRPYGTRNKFYLQDAAKYVAKSVKEYLEDEEQAPQEDFVLRITDAMLFGFDCSYNEIGQMLIEADKIAGWGYDAKTLRKAIAKAYRLAHENNERWKYGSMRPGNGKKRPAKVRKNT